MLDKKSIKLQSLYKLKLFFKNKVFYCQIGSKGLTQSFSKKEGDSKTPRGKWKLGKIFLRFDKNKMLKTNKKIRKNIFPILKNSIWCDDNKSHFYNKHIKYNNNVKKNITTYENLFRLDDVYDFIIEIKTNSNPIIKNKGSAIFIHCSFNDLRSTKGCIALKKVDLKFIISNLNNEKYIYIK